MNDQEYRASKTLQEINRALSNVTKMIDALDYESLAINRVDDAMNKTYQAIFAAGDGINEARAAIRKVTS
jgi:hypothetical protein